jgi:hypothetical protein
VSVLRFKAMRENEIEYLKRMFAGLNNFISERGGWLVSVPGDPLMRMECLTDSPLPEALRQMGYDVEATGQSRERMIPNAITEQLVRTSSGAFAFASQGSTAKIALRVTHAGLVLVDEFRLHAP